MIQFWKKGAVMLKTEFEKKHGKVSSNKATIGVKNLGVEKKYNLYKDDQPAAIWYIVQAMPDERFKVIDLSKIKTIFECVGQIKHKDLRDYYLAVLEDRFFSNGWGWFTRLGESLSARPRWNSVYAMPEVTRLQALKALRCLKRGFMKYHYNGTYVDIYHINHLIQEYGGKRLDKKQTMQKATEKLNGKLPRKQKKKVQGFLKTIFSKNR